MALIVNLLVALRHGYLELADSLLQVCILKIESLDGFLGGVVCLDGELIKLAQLGVLLSKHSIHFEHYFDLVFRFH